MGTARIKNQTDPVTPASGYTEVFVDSADKKIKTLDDAGLLIDLTGGGGTVQGADGTYDIEAANEGATAGNARGENSVDLCTKRSNAAYVPSGICSMNAAGENNGGTGTHSLISGKINYNNSGNYCSISGYHNHTNTGSQCSISGSSNSDNSGSWCNISGSFNYGNSGNHCSISGGGYNAGNHTNSGRYCNISGTSNHTNSGRYCNISGKSNSSNTGDYCLISGDNVNSNALDLARVHGGDSNARIIDLVAQINSVGTGATELLLSGSGGTQIIIPDQSAWAVEVHFVAKTATGVNASMQVWHGLLARETTTTTWVANAVQAAQVDTGTTNATFTIDTDAATEALRLNVTVSSGTCRAVARVHLTQVDY